MATNYLRVPNPFHLAEPPAWWMRHLATFDDQLVIFPSQKRPVFCLGRRARVSRGVQPADVLNVENHPDTVIMANHGFVPVTHVMPGAIWDYRVFEKLAERDTWRHGAKKMADRMDELDLRHEKRVQRQIDDELEARSSDAFASMKYRGGERISMAHRGAANNTRSKPQHFDRKVKAASQPPQQRVVLATA